MNLCKYKDIFGEPNKGVHQYRVLNIAIIDVLSTILLSYLISQYANVSFIKTLIILLIIAEFMHLLFCVDTPITQYFKKNDI